ncbi:FAD-binding protein [Ferrimonas pelagia]|uniref:FAD-binding protein n=1 Tax=Ferrimonas pelagia TaxID=1177826 RepID=A0ABP9EPJ5_9GAMM
MSYEQPLELTDTQPPQQIVPEAVDWQGEYDVVVVGYGGAGICAAIEAVDAGASVLALDRFQGGGATAASGGVVYAGGGTQYQQDAGFEDSADNMFAYLKQETGDAVSDETLRRFCQQSCDNLRWLEANRVGFAGNVPPIKTSYPTNQYYLYYSGNEAVGGYKDKATPAPRGHRVKGAGMSGQALFRALRASAAAKGVKLQTQTEVQCLLTDAHDRVIGVEVRTLPAGWISLQHKWLSALIGKLHLYSPRRAFKLRAKLVALERQHGQIQRICARNGVVLSAGGFAFNRKMVERYNDKYRKGLPLGTTGCNGSGIGLGHSVGGALARMDKFSAWRFINPPLAWAQGMVVNGAGERYCNEEVYGAKLGHEMCEHNDGRAYLVINHAQRAEALKQCVPGKAQSFQILPALMNLFLNAKKADSIEGLAKRMKLPEAALRAELDSYNAAARGECVDRFGKSPAFLKPMAQGPYYGINVSFDSPTFPCPMISLGGLKVCEHSGQVLDQEERIIPGLYAAGRNAVGVASNLYVSGISIADCVFSGRRAGAHVAAQRRGETAKPCAESSAA